MNLEILREYCLKKPGAAEDLPFDEDSPVYKVLGKIFCIAGLNPPITINLKCDPEKAVELREEHEEIQPGYHMNKVHWNTVSLEGSLRDDFILKMIDHSYNLVVQGLKKSDKEKLNLL